MIKKIFFLILFLMLIPSVFSVPPFVQDIQVNSNNNVLDITYPKFKYFIKDDFIKLHFHVHNSTGYLLDNTTTSCIFHLHDKDGNHIVEDFLDFDNNGIDFKYELNESFTQDLGIYTYIVDCESTNEAGFLSLDYEIINENEKNLDNLLFGQIFIVIFFLVCGFFNKAKLWSRIINFGFAFIEFIVLNSTLYLNYIGQDISLILKLNSTIFIIVGFFFGFLTLLQHALAIYNEESEQEKPEKWKK